MSVPARNRCMKKPLRSDRHRCLLVAGSLDTKTDIETQLKDMGYALQTCETGNQALEALESNTFDMVLMNLHLPDMSGRRLVQQIKVNSAEDCVPIVLLIAAAGDDVLYDCMQAGGDDFLSLGYTAAEFSSRISAIEQLRELRLAYRSSIQEQVVARKILSAALSSRNTVVKGMRVLSRSVAVFSGDLVLTAHKPDGGLNFLLADFTGHGLSSAIGILPVAELFNVMTTKGFGPEVILQNINTKLYTLLPTAMFMAACMVEIKTGARTACVWNCGMPDVYLLDCKAGTIKRKIKSAHIPLGINQEIDSRLEFDDFDIAPEDQFIMHSDGLTDATDASGQMFGVPRLEKILEETPEENIFGAIVNEFDQFCENQKLSDDITLITFPCRHVQYRSSNQDLNPDLQTHVSADGGWRLMLEVSGESLRHVDPVPIIVDQYNKLDEPVVCVDKLRCIISALYENALNHGVLEISNLTSPGAADENSIENERYRRFDSISGGFVRIEVQRVIYQGKSSILIKLEDSGSGFDHLSMLSESSREQGARNHENNGGIQMVRDMCQSLRYQGRGNRVEAVISD